MTRKRPRGFSLVELLVVIGIIAVLIGILFPVIGKVRTQGHITDTRAFLTQLDGAIQRYYGDFQAYPGPVPNDECGYNTTSLVPPKPADTIYSTDTGRDLNRNMTGTENLVLGLLGGLWRNPKNLDSNNNPRPEFDINRLLSAQGPASMNTVGLPKVTAAYVEAKNIFTGPDPVFASKTNGFYRDGSGFAGDTEIPEFLDRFPSAMPLLYMRASTGATAPPGVAPSAYTKTSNPVIVDSGTSPPVPPAQYDLRHISGYTALSQASQAKGMSYIGEGKKIRADAYKNGDPANKFPAHGLRTVDPKSSMDKNPPSPQVYVYPYDAYAYFSSPTSPNTARSKDGYVLISAGPDRIYGTDDDICNFGAVQP
jgi:prepilin-type N-terminal cleavage/methylation domain-containing protein